MFSAASRPEFPRRREPSPLRLDAGAVEAAAAAASEAVPTTLDEAIEQLAEKHRLCIDLLSQIDVLNERVHSLLLQNNLLKGQSALLRSLMKKNSSPVVPDTPHSPSSSGPTSAPSAPSPSKSQPMQAPYQPQMYSRVPSSPRMAAIAAPQDTGSNKSLDQVPSAKPQKRPYPDAPANIDFSVNVPISSTPMSSARPDAVFWLDIVREKIPDFSPSSPAFKNQYSALKKALHRFAAQKNLEQVGGRLHIPASMHTEFYQMISNRLDSHDERSKRLKLLHKSDAAQDTVTIAADESLELELPLDSEDKDTESDSINKSSNSPSNQLSVDPDAVVHEGGINSYLSAGDKANENHQHAPLPPPVQSHSANISDQSTSLMLAETTKKVLLPSVDRNLSTDSTKKNVSTFTGQNTIRVSQLKPSELVFHKELSTTLEGGVPNTLGYRPWSEVIQARYPLFDSSSSMYLKVTEIMRKFHAEKKIPRVTCIGKPGMGIPASLHLALLEYVESYSTVRKQLEETCLKPAGTDAPAISTTVFKGGEPWLEVLRREIKGFTDYARTHRGVYKRLMSVTRRFLIVQGGDLTNMSIPPALKQKFIQEVQSSGVLDELTKDEWKYVGISQGALPGADGISSSKLPKAVQSKFEPKTASELVVKTPALGATRANEIILSILPKFFQLDPAVQGAVKKGVRMFLEEVLDEAEVPSDLVVNGGEDYLIPETEREMFVEWLYDQFRECFPDEELRRRAA
ncbi:hypothetical protein HDU84_003846 [Entophlyctis sp. JEL0112]|nr:hypothetical protein HDU84_003846 [Entophlyctis sp. JEL0112]